MSLSINKANHYFLRKEKRNNLFVSLQNVMKKIERKNFIDVILFAFAIYLLFTTNWSNVDKFSQLLLLMYALCITLRIGNIIKIKQN